MAQGQVSLPAGKWVYADVNCDDSATAQEFRKHFKVEGNMLPFVVIADSEGKQLAARSGYGEAQDFDDLIHEAKKKLPKETSAPKSLTALKAASNGTGVGDVPIPADENREVRTWTALSGQAVRAALVQESKGQIVLKQEDGQKITATLQALSPADQNYVLGLKRAGTNFPPKAVAP